MEFVFISIITYMYTKRTKRVHCPFRIHEYCMELKSINFFDHSKQLCCVHKNRGSWSIIHSINIWEPIQF